jgi:hypothetical protein
MNDIVDVVVGISGRSHVLHIIELISSLIAFQWFHRELRW